MAMRMRFNSLKTRLTIALLLLVFLPTITIGWVAYNTMFETIRSERIKAVGRIADSKHGQLVTLLTRANIRAEHFLSDLSDQCRGNSAKLNQSCATSLIRAYLAAEGAIGATLYRKGDGDSLTVGTPAAQNKESIRFQTGQLAKFSGDGPDNNRSYFVSVAEEATGLQLTITYLSSLLEPVFNPPPADLGLSGETFLADGVGYFVTKPRYHSTQGQSHPIYARPMQACLSGQSLEVLDRDYRDTAIIHGFRFIPEFGSACIMAHIAQDEAFAPLNLLRQRLIFATLLFCIILVITIIYLARSVVKPITNLTKVTRAIAAGDNKNQADTAGNDEISELATSFNFMTNQLVQSEKMLRKSSEEIEDLYNHAPCGYHSLDKDGIIRRINDTELAWMGYTRDEVIGKMKWPDLLTPASQKIFREDYPRLMKQGFIHDIEIEIVRKDGTTFTGLVNATAIYDSPGNYVMSRSTVADITERKRVEQQLRELAAHLQAVRENEKVSIAREIHDELGGMLTTLKIETYWLRTELSASKENMLFLDHVGEMSRLIDNAADVMRNIITGLRPSILDDLGLVAALEWQAAQFHKHTGIACRVNCVCERSEDCVKELDKPRSIALFRISQEALTNVARHSGASRVDIEFHRNEEEIVMSIIDNGHGMAENRTDAPSSYGILGMRERVNQLDGKINFGPMPGGGFNVTVILPLSANEEEET